MAPKNTVVQTVWGALLLLAGVAVFFRIPQVMPRIETIAQFASISGLIRFSFYLIGVMLIGGGAKKIYANYRALTGSKTDTE